MIMIGIDPGSTTGFALWEPNRKELISVGSDSMLKVMNLVLFQCKEQEHLIIIEDARLRKKFTKSEWSPKRLQGAGSIRRDCSLWEEFCQENDLNYVMKHPRLTKLSAETFERLTKWEGRTNTHSRDAACIVFGMGVNQGKLLSRR